MEITADWQKINFEEILALYDTVGWSAYTRDSESLRGAFEKSSLVLVAIEESQVVGVSRSISDGVSIHYLQDILVSPKFQRKGVGRKLLQKALKNFEEVRTHMILTDNEEKQKLFYESLGYKNLKDLKKCELNAFIKMSGVELE